MTFQITLPIETEIIECRNIPMLIATEITPAEIADDITVLIIFKRVIPLDYPYEEETASEILPLEILCDSDWKSLNLLSELADLQPLTKANKLRDDISLAEWGHYEKVFNENIKNTMYFAYSIKKLNLIANKHEEFLLKAIINNDITVYDYLTHIPLENPTKLSAFNNTYMTVSDFTSYSKQFNLTVNLGVEHEQGNLSNTYVLKKTLVSEQQNLAVLTWLKDKNYDPKKLPTPPCGKAGVKKECREELCMNLKLFSSKSVFNTTWDRLRANLEIQDAM